MVMDITFRVRIFYSSACLAFEKGEKNAAQASSHSGTLFEITKETLLHRKGVIMVRKNFLTFC